MHGSVITAFDKSSVKIKEILKGGFQLFHNSPGRREDYESVSGSTKYPLLYFATRRVENKLVAEAMIEVWPNLIKLINFWTSIPNSKPPTCKNYGNVCDAVKDPFMISKLMFFSFVCGLVELYLNVFQGDRPMVPLIYSEVKSVIKSLLSLIVKPSIIEKFNTATGLENINLSSEENLLQLKKDVQMGFGMKK